MGIVVHLVAYVSVNAMLVLVWAAGGDDRSIGDALAHPVDAVQNDGFWPVWSLGGWGSLLAIHIAVAAKVAQRRRRRRRKERAIGRSQARAAARQHAAGAVDAALGALSTGRPTTTAAAAGPIGRHWVVALFTDVVGSTGLAEALGDDEWNEIVLGHRRLVRSMVVDHQGVEVGTQGDGFLLRFDDPADGVRCAIALQRRFEEERRTGAFSPPVRIGLHAGEVVGVEDGDLVGRMVNVASRVTAVARAGEIVVTEPVADQLGPEIVLRDHGLHALRGIERPRHLLTVAWEDELPLPDPAEPVRPADAGP